MLSGIARSCENTVRYGRHRGKNSDLASVAFSRTSRYWVYPSFLLTPVSSCGSVTAKRSFMWHRPATPYSGSLFPSDRLVSSAVVAYAAVGLAGGVLDLPPLPLIGDALFLVRFPVYLRFFLPSCDTLR